MVSGGGLKVNGIAKQKKVPKAVTTTGKCPRFYPADEVQRPLQSRKKNMKPTTIHSRIQPSTIEILLVGRFHGKHVVLLKALQLGLLFVCGMFKTNGVPLCCISQPYVITNSTNVNVSNRISQI